MLFRSLFCFVLFASCLQSLSASGSEISGPKPSKVEAVGSWVVKCWDKNERQPQRRVRPRSWWAHSAADSLGECTVSQFVHIKNQTGEFSMQIGEDRQSQNFKVALATSFTDLAAEGGISLLTNGDGVGQFAKIKCVEKGCLANSVDASAFVRALFLAESAQILFRRRNGDHSYVKFPVDGVKLALTMAFGYGLRGRLGASEAIRGYVSLSDIHRLPKVILAAYDARARTNFDRVPGECELKISGAEVSIDGPNLNLLSKQHASMDMIARSVSGCPDGRIVFLHSSTDDAFPAGDQQRRRSTFPTAGFIAPNRKVSGDAYLHYLRARISALGVEKSKIVLEEAGTELLALRGSEDAVQDMP